jgi:2-C-methyl-D-erythritol 4-phosphate cytidylyltransferase
LTHPDIATVQVVIGDGHRPLYDQAVAGLDGLPEPVQGGATRQESVFNGITAVAATGADHVLIHDAARPFHRRRPPSLPSLQNSPKCRAAFPQPPLPTR